MLVKLQTHNGSGKLTEQDARAALRAHGITNPSKALIENWLRVQQNEETASPPPALRETVVDMQPCIKSFPLSRGRKQRSSAFERVKPRTNAARTGPATAGAPTQGGQTAHRGAVVSGPCNPDGRWNTDAEGISQLGNPFEPARNSRPLQKPRPLSDAAHSPREVATRMGHPIQNENAPSQRLPWGGLLGLFAGIAPDTLKQRW